MTADERVQLRRNCIRTMERTTDSLLATEAAAVMSALDETERREWAFLPGQSPARRIEYAFRRLPAGERDRRLVRLLHEHPAATPRRLSTALGEADEAAWQRAFGKLIRDRRHLLLSPDSLAELEQVGQGASDWAWLITEVTGDERTVRLTDAAVEAFARVGYIDPVRSAPEAPASDTGSRAAA